MKKTMLTYKTLDRFEREYETAQYNADEIETIEHCAYVANMNQCNHPEWNENDIFADFLRCLASPYKHIAIIPKNTDPTEPTETETTTNEEENTMTTYNYEESMKADILDYIAENIDRADYIGEREDLENTLNDDCWIADSVTGNASGSYYCNAYKAKAAVLDNMEYCTESLKEFCTEPKTIADRFLHEDWEFFDVTIRCYLLGSMIADVLDELENAGYFEENEVDDSDIIETVKAEIA